MVSSYKQKNNNFRNKKMETLNKDVVNLRPGCTIQIPEQREVVFDLCDKTTLSKKFFINLVNGATVYQEDASFRINPPPCRVDKSDIELFIVKDNKILFCICKESATNFLTGIFTEIHTQSLFLEECFKEEQKQITELKKQRKYEEAQNMINSIRIQGKEMIEWCFNNVVVYEDVKNAQNFDDMFQMASKRRLLHTLKERAEQTV